jgi:hypothetical protein
MLGAAKVHAYLKKGLACAKYQNSGALYIAPTVVVAKVENGRKRTENRSTVFVFIFLDGNGSGSRDSRERKR